MNTSLNNIEKLVYNAVYDAAKLSTGGDFTYADEVYDIVKDQMSQNQLKGYLSQLVQKNMIVITSDKYKQILGERGNPFYESYPKFDI